MLLQEEKKQNKTGHYQWSEWQNMIDIQMDRQVMCYI